MLGYRIKLKTKRQIEKLCYEAEDGRLGLDGVAFNHEFLKEYNFNDSKVLFSVFNNGIDNIPALCVFSYNCFPIILCMFKSCCFLSSGV